MPTALTLALRPASACIRPTTAAAPPMSPFMSSMPPAGLIEMPPVSKTTPLPTKATGASPSVPPFQCMTTSRGGRGEPCATPSSAPMLSFVISLVAEDLDLDAEPCQFLGLRSANSTGPRMLAGSLTRSRASIVPSAIASSVAKAARAASGSATAKVSAEASSALLSSSSSSPGLAFFDL